MFIRSISFWRLSIEITLQEHSISVEGWLLFFGFSIELRSGDLAGDSITPTSLCKNQSYSEFGRPRTYVLPCFFRHQIKTNSLHFLPSIKYLSIFGWVIPYIVLQMKLFLQYVLLSKVARFLDFSGSDYDPSICFELFQRISSTWIPS